MRRYLIFAGSKYDCAGGWSDFHSDADDINSADAIIQAANAETILGWYQIVDTQTGKIVKVEYS